VPGDNERKLAKAAGLAVDEVERAPHPRIDGVAQLDGEMVDAANRRMAESILARERRTP
jgi:citrate lyase beta subunit